MGDPLEAVRDAKRREELSEVRDRYGEIITSTELRRLVRGFGTRRGIFKPAGISHALWVRQTKNSPYADRDPEFQPDGSWIFRYSPQDKKGNTDLDLDANQAMLRAQRDRIPVGVFRQVESLEGKAAYRVWGLAFVEGFDGTHFLLRGEGIDVEKTPLAEKVEPTFEPFELSPLPLAEVVRKLRDRRFGVAIRQLYHEKCSLCNMGFRVRGSIVALDAAHIIPVEKKGVVADLRNGILLCKNHHALFDESAWTMDEDLRILVAPDQDLRKTAIPNHLLRAEGKKLVNLPSQPADYPAPAAVKWRVEEFERAWKSS